MKTTIYTSYDCLLKTSTWQRNLDKNNSLSFDDLEEDIFVYPTGKCKIIPFTITKNESNIFYKTIIHNGRLLIFLIDGIFVENVLLYNFSFNGRSSKVSLSNKVIHFSTKSTKKIISLTNKFEQFICKNCFHINYVICKSEKYNLLIFFNTLNGKIKTYECKDISLNNKEFVITSFYDEKITLYIDKDGLKVKEKTTKLQIYPNPLYVAKNFMEEIKKEEYTSALNLLSDNLKENQTIYSIKEYFGEISFIYPIDLYTIFAISNGNGKIYTFEIDRGKITEIND